MKHRPQSILFATTNEYKIKEASVIFAECQIIIKPIQIEIIEPQSNDATYISKSKVRQAYNITKQPVIVDDAGLFIHRLNGFPGTNTASTMKAIGIDNLYRLIDEDEPAKFQSVVSYFDGTDIITVVGQIEGVLRKVPIITINTLLSDVFYPTNETRNLSELSSEGYASHRKIALVALLNKLGE